MHFLLDALRIKRYYYVCVFHYSDGVHTDKFQDNKTVMISADPDSMKSATTRTVQYKRIKHIHDMCKSRTSFSTVMNKLVHTRRPMYYESKLYNFSYCRMPKAGSTFWVQVFMILKKGPSEASSLFGKFRHFLKIADDAPENLDLTMKQRQQSRFIFVARDPYSRLFSAFVDRVFLPTQYNEVKAIINLMRNNPKNTISCSYDLTFEELLTSIIMYVNSGRPLNMHWAPMYSLCDPCGVEIVALVKMESFSEDVEFALKEIGAPAETLEAIKDGLHKHRIEWTIPGSVKGIIESSKSPLNCLNPTEVARRMWVSFQIQGYIDEKNKFPFDIIDTVEKAANHSFLTNVILDVIKEYPLSPEERKQQRRRALVNAYAGIDENIMLQIKNIFNQDFILYDYPLEPPSGA